MNSRTLSAGLTILLALALVAPIVAADKPTIVRFDSNVVSTNLRTSTVLQIEVHEWTSENDRLAAQEAFKVGGNAQLYKLLHAWPDNKASLRVNNSLAYELSYAYTYKSDDGFDNYVLATARPIGFLETMNNARSMDQDISLIIIAVDQKTGKGQGRASAGVEFGTNEKTGELTLKHLGTQPANLTKVVRRAPKAKK